jgi:hypothetical protein
MEVEPPPPKHAGNDLSEAKKVYNEGGLGILSRLLAHLMLIECNKNVNEILSSSTAVCIEIRIEGNAYLDGIGTSPPGHFAVGIRLRTTQNNEPNANIIPVQCGPHPS